MSRDLGRERRLEVRLSTWILKDLVDICIEAHGPKTDAGHELLGGFQLFVAAEEAFYECDAALIAHGQWRLVAVFFLSRLPHVFFADLEEFGEADPETGATLKEVFDQFALSLVTDAHDFGIGLLDLACEMDEEQPEFTGHLGNWNV